MKFEPVVNGNVNSNSNSNMPTTQNTEQQHTKAESESPSPVYEKDIESEEQPNDTDVGGGDGNGAGGCDDDGDKDASGSNGAGGKKKNARKKRSLNWEEAERGSLLEVIKPKVDFVENRNVDAKSIKAKRMAWLNITKQFNALNFRHRSLEQIQVQWRSMKNSAKREYQQKHPKVIIEGMEMIEFMEELQKDTLTSTSSGKRSHHTNATNKKDILDIDDEDTPLASLPTSTNTSEDTLQTSTIAIPSPPPSAESQNDTQLDAPLRNKKKRGSTANSTIQKDQKEQQHIDEPTTPSPTSSGRKRQRRQNSSQSDVDVTMNVQSQLSTSNQQESTVNEQAHDNNSPTPAMDMIALENSKYKRQLLDLMKRTRLAEMEYARREHEQRLRYEEMRQELVLGLYREQEQLKMQQIREEHEMRLRYSQLEHEARMRAFTLNARNLNAKVKDENSDD